MKAESITAEITVDVRPINTSELTSISLPRAARPTSVHAYEYNSGEKKPGGMQRKAEEECVEMANPIATPTPILNPCSNPETRFHSLVNIPVQVLPPECEVVAAARVASKNSCLWRIIFVMFPLNDGDTETLEEEVEEDMFLFFIYLLFIIYYCYV
jgi:hypothetical protein